MIISESIFHINEWSNFFDCFQRNILSNLFMSIKYINYLKTYLYINAYNLNLYIYTIICLKTLCTCMFYIIYTNNL